MKLSIVIPVYNEKNHRGVEIIIVDDGSTDGTGEILKGLKQPNIKVIFHSRNQGKGAALHTGFSEAEGDIILVQDADLNYAQNVPMLLMHILFREHPPSFFALENNLA